MARIQFRSRPGSAKEASIRQLLRTSGPSACQPGSRQAPPGRSHVQAGVTPQCVSSQAASVLPRLCLSQSLGFLVFIVPTV